MRETENKKNSKRQKSAQPYKQYAHDVQVIEVTDDDDDFKSDDVRFDL